MNDSLGQNLFDFSPGYRKGQATSKSADEGLVSTGQKATQSQLTYMAVRNHANGCTSAEIALAGKIPHSVVWRRLSSLRDHGYLREGKPRKCKVSGRKAKTWWLI